MCVTFGHMIPPQVLCPTDYPLAQAVNCLVAVDLLFSAWYPVLAGPRSHLGVSCLRVPVFGVALKT